MAKQTLLYLLLSKNNKQFKIGISYDISTRITALGGTNLFDLRKSHIVRLPTSRDAHKIESILHYLFDSYRVGAPNGTRGGFTEWFNINCYSEVLDTIRKILTNINLSHQVIHQGVHKKEQVKSIRPYIVRKTKEELNVQYLEELNLIRQQCKLQVDFLLQKISELEPYFIKVEHYGIGNLLGLSYEKNENSEQLLSEIYNDLGSFYFKHCKGSSSVVAVTSLKWDQSNINRVIGFGTLKDLNEISRFKGFEELERITEMVNQKIMLQ